MRNLLPQRIFLSLLLCGLLSACNTLQKKEKDENPNVDLLEVEKLASEAYEREDYVVSEEHYSTLVREVPMEILPWFRLGNIYARSNRYDAAVLAYREVLIRDQTYANAWFNLAIVQLKQAASSFNEMQIYTDPSHPLHKKSKETFEGILELIKSDPEEN